MWPMPRAPISTTRWAVAASARSTVSGTPSSLLLLAAVATVGSGGGQHVGEQVLGAGLALRPGQRQHRSRRGGRRRGGPAGPRATAGSATTTVGATVGAAAEHRVRAVGEVVAVDPLPHDATNSPPRRRARGCRRTPPRRRRGRGVAVHRSAGDAGDLGEGQRDHRDLPASAVEGASATAGRRRGARRRRPPGRSRGPCRRPARRRRVGPAPTARAIAARGRRSRAPRAGARRGAPASTAARMAAGSSVRGLSSVTTSTSASRAAISPMIGRLPGSRSPPAPSTTMTRRRAPRRAGAACAIAASTASGLWA